MSLKKDGLYSSPLFDTLSRFQTRIFVIFFVCAGVLVSLPNGSDYYIYYDAVHAVLNNKSAYFPIDIGYTFVYHPILLTVMLPFSILPPSLSFIVWSILSVAALLLSIYLLSNREWQTWYWLFLFFIPVTHNFTLGQINTFILLVLVLTLHFSEKKKPMWAGIFLAIAIIIKLSPVILLAYFVARKQWHIIAYTLLALVIMSLIGILQFGLQTTIEYSEVIRFAAQDFTLTRYNLNLQSYMGEIMLRISQSGLSLDLAQGAIVIVWINRILFLISAGFAFFFTLKASPAKSAIAFALFVTLSTFFSPLLWLHHLVLLILPVMILFRYKADTRWILLILGLVQLERILFFVVQIAENLIPTLPHVILLFDSLIIRLPSLSAQLIIIVLLFRMLIRTDSNQNDEQFLDKSIEPQKA